MKRPPNKPKPGDPISAAFFSEIIESILSIQNEMRGLILNSGTGYRVSRSSNGTSLTIDRQAHVPASPTPPKSVKPGGFKCKIVNGDKESKLYASGGNINTYDGSKHEVDPVEDWKEICTLGKEKVSVYVNIELSETGKITTSELTEKKKETKPFRPKDPNMQQGSASGDAGNHISVEIAKVKIIPPKEGQTKPSYELIQMFEGAIELQLFGIQEQENEEAESSDVYGGIYAILKEIKDRTAILKRLKGDEGINISSKNENQSIDIRLVKADSTSSTPRLGGVNSVSVEIVPLDSSEQSRIEDGQIKIFIKQKTDSNDLSW